MRTLIVIAMIGATACTSHPRKDEPAAREVGREAYTAVEQVKRGAKKAAKELRHAGKEIREGWNEKKREEKGQP